MRDTTVVVPRIGLLSCLPVEKVQRELADYREFAVLAEQIVEVNETSMPG